MKWEIKGEHNIYQKKVVLLKNLLILKDYISKGYVTELVIFKQKENFFMVWYVMNLQCCSIENHQDQIYVLSWHFSTRPDRH